MLHRQQLGVDRRQRARFLQRFERFGRQRVQRRFVDTVETFDLTLAAIAIHGDRPRLQQLVVGQRLADALGQLPVGLHLRQKAQNVLHRLGGAAIGIKKRLALTFGEQSAVGIEGEHLLAIGQIRQRERVGAVGCRRIGSQPTPLGRDKEVLTGLDAEDCHRRELPVLGDKSDRQVQNGARQLLRHQRRQGIVRGKSVAVVALPALVGVGGAGDGLESGHGLVSLWGLFVSTLYPNALMKKNPSS